MDLALVEIDESWLPAMFRWLTDPYTNRMARVGDLTPEGQRQWFDSLAGRTDYWIRGMVGDGRQVGAVGLKHIEGTRAEAFVYVGDEAARGSGVATWGIRQLDGVAAARGIRTVRAIVARENLPSLKLFERTGYVVSGSHGDWGVVLEKPVGVTSTNAGYRSAL